VSRRAKTLCYAAGGFVWAVVNGLFVAAAWTSGASLSDHLAATAFIVLIGVGLGGVMVAAAGDWL